LNYIGARITPPPKSLLRALNQLKKRDDILITKPDKRTGVVVMDKSEYIKLLSEASINNHEKFKTEIKGEDQSRTSTLCRRKKKGCN
jgi:hypothetical protein